MIYLRKTHREAKKKILVNIKSKLNMLNEKNIGHELTIKNLYYLPLIFINRRPNRNLKKTIKHTFYDNLHKIMNYR